MPASDVAHALARSWACSTLLLGVANLWVALNTSEDDWVNFKVWIAIPLGFVFTLGVILLAAARL